MGKMSFHCPGMRGPFTDPALLGNWAIDWAQLRYMPDEHVWFLSISANGYEVCISGDTLRPDPGRLAVAQAVTGRLSELTAKVLGYLDTSLDYGKVGSSGDWHLEGISFGYDHSQPQDFFDVVLTTDEYGDWNDCELWNVTCSFTKGGNFEVHGQRGGWYGRYLAEQNSGSD